MTRPTRFLQNAFALAALLSGTSFAAQQYRPVLTPAPGDPGVDLQSEFHPNGQLAKRVFLKDGRPEGLWQEWDAEGRVRMTLEWRDGKGEGVWTYFHPNGIVSERSWVADDVWDGPSEGWHANGQKAFEGVHARGAKRGPFRYWDEDGAPRGPGAQLLTPAPEPVSVLSEGWSPELNVWDIALSHDLETLFAGVGDDEGKIRRIVVRRWQRNAWQPAEPAPFSDSTASEGMPSLSPDGEWIYFSSSRHSSSEPGNSLRDMYRASRASGWKNVERVTNTPLYGEVSLALASDGSGVLWTDRKRDGAAKMGFYEVRLTSADGAPNLTVTADLSALHREDKSGEAYPALAPDGSFLLFSNYDIHGAGTSEDIFISRRTPTGWSEPRALIHGAHSVGDDTPSQLLNGGKTLLFRSSRTAGLRTYRVSLEAVLAP